MNNSRSPRTRRIATLVALGLGCGLVAPAFAGSHVSVSVGVALPGLSVGYSDYHYARHHHYRDDDYRARHVYRRAPVYYAPAPRVVYYERPVVVERPVYVRRGYETRVIYRDHDRGNYRHHDGDRHHRRHHDRDDD